MNKLHLFTGSTVLALAGMPVRAFGAGPASPFGGGLSQLFPIVIMFGIFYFLLIRPQQKKAKLHDQFLSELKRGDMIVTNAGIVGVVRTLGEKLVTLEVDEGVCLKILRTQISESASNLKEDGKSKSGESLKTKTT